MMPPTSFLCRTTSTFLKYRVCIYCLPSLCSLGPWILLYTNICQKYFFCTCVHMFKVQLPAANVRFSVCSVENSDWEKEMSRIYPKRNTEASGVSQTSIKRFPVLGTKISRQQVTRFQVTWYKRFHHHRVCTRTLALIWSWNETPNHWLNLI